MRKKRRPSETPAIERFTERSMESYSTQYVTEMEMIVLTIARDTDPFDLHQWDGGRLDEHLFEWVCRYCQQSHSVKQDRYGWPEASNVRKFGHAHECPWYWAQIWAKKRSPVSWPTVVDPNHTKPVPQMPPIYRRLRSFDTSHTSALRASDVRNETPVTFPAITTLTELERGA